jgi:hypothetical protein
MKHDKKFSAYLNKIGKHKPSKKAPNKTKGTKFEGCKSKEDTSL